MQAWLSQAGLAPEQVVAVTPSAATLMISRRGPARGRGEALLRAVSLNEEASLRSGVRAWEMRLEVDCPGRLVRPGETVGYPDGKPDENGLRLAPAETAWRAPNAGTTLEAAWRAMCDPQFRFPLAGGRRMAEAPDVSPLRPAPLPPSPAPAASFARNVTAQAPTAAPTRRSAAAVQVISSPAEADTRRALAALQGEISGLQTRIEPAQVRGRRVYRGLVAGFGERADAERFCAALKGSGRDCLVR